MKKNGEATLQMPTSAQLEAEIKREKHSVRFRSALRRTIITFVLVVSLCASAAYFFLPVLRVHSSSMAETIRSGDMLVAVKGPAPERDDIIAFIYEGKTLIRRVAALPGDEVRTDASGGLYVNGGKLLSDSGYTLEKPIVVERGQLFVLGDNAREAVDSRHEEMGCIDAQSVIGVVYARIWPFEQREMFEPVWEKIGDWIGREG